MYNDGPFRSIGHGGIHVKYMDKQAKTQTLRAERHVDQHPGVGTTRFVVTDFGSSTAASNLRKTACFTKIMM